MRSASLNAIPVITPLCPGGKEWFWLQRFRLSVHIKHRLSESFDVLREIRTELNKATYVSLM